jgi:hypothetical protein
VKLCELFVLIKNGAHHPVPEPEILRRYKSLSAKTMQEAVNINIYLHNTLSIK